MLIRKQKGINQYELSKLTGISQSVLCDIENDKKRARDVYIKKISKALDIPLSIINILSFDFNEIKSEAQEDFLTPIWKAKKAIQKHYNIKL